MIADHLEQFVPGLAGGQGAEDRAEEGGVLKGVAEDVGSGEEQRRRQDGAGEDDRHDAAGVDLEREVGGLATHHLAADDALGVLDGDAALGALDEDDEGYDGDHACDEKNEGDRSKGSPCGVAELLVEVFNASRETDDDAGEDEKAHAVADAALGDLLAEPHDEGGAGGERDDAEGNEGSARDGDHRLAGAGASQRERDGEGLHDAEEDGDVAGPLGDLAAAEFAFLLQLRERLVDDGEQLEDDRRRDVRHDAEGEDGELAEVAAGEEVDQAEG